MSLSEDDFDNEFANNEGNAQVLIIDDQQFNLFAMQGQLYTEFKVGCDTAMSGEKALEVVK